MSIPHSVIAAGWIPFVVVIVLAFLFAWIYVRWYQHHELSEVCTTLVSVLALFVTLMTSALVPVDVFLISYMKNKDGTFKDWAASNATRNSIEDTITYGYYALYGLVGLFVFLVLPFMYFYYEEKDDEEVSRKQRCCTSLKFTMVFLLAAFVILLTGALVPLKKAPANMPALDKKFEFLKDQLENYNNAKQCMSILVGVLSMFGMLTLIQYAGFGLSALPLSMIKCCSKYKDDEAENSGRLTKRELDEAKMEKLRAKTRGGRQLTRFERNEMRRIEQDERLRHRVDRKKNKIKTSRCGKLLLLLKPFEVVFGVVFLAISLLIMVSLTITSIDKALHSMGPKVGYTLSKPVLPNPVNIVMVYAHSIFPLDYVLFTGIVLFFFFACMNGIKRMGIWCCCIKMFKIGSGRTMPQALLFMSFILMFMVIALNIVLFTAMPQYIQYGNQKYPVYHGNHTHSNHTHGNHSLGFHDSHVANMTVETCNTRAPQGECIMSRIALILNTLFYKAWFFGAFFYWSTWALIGVYYLGLFYNIICISRKKTYEEDLLSSDEEDAGDLDRLVHA